MRIVADGMGLDHRIGPHFLQAGIGYGGSCFPKDVQALKQLAGNSGYHFQLFNAVMEVNHLQKRRVVGKLSERLGRLRGKHDRPARPHLQAPDRRPARGRLHSAGRPAASPKAPACRPTTPCSGRARTRAVPRRRDRRERPRGSRGRRRGRARHRVARVLALDWAVVAAACGGRHVIDGRNFLDRTPRDRRRAFDYGGIGTAMSRWTATRSALPRASVATARARRLVVRSGRRRWSAARGRACGRSPRACPSRSRPWSGRPFVGYILENLARHGVRRAVFSAGYLAHALEDSIGDGSATAWP